MVFPENYKTFYQIVSTNGTKQQFWQFLIFAGQTLLARLAGPPQPPLNRGEVGTMAHHYPRGEGGVGTGNMIVF